MNIKDIYKQYKNEEFEKAYTNVQAFNDTKDRTDETLYLEFLISYTKMFDKTNKEYLDFFLYSFKVLKDRRKITAKFLVEITYELSMFSKTRTFINYLETKCDYTEDIFLSYKIRIMVYLDNNLNEALSKAKELVNDTKISSLIRSDALLTIYEIYKEYNDISKLESLNEYTTTLIELEFDNPQAIYYNNLDIGVYYNLEFEYFSDNLEQLRFYNIYMDTYMELTENLLLKQNYSVVNIFLNNLVLLTDDGDKESIFRDYLYVLSGMGETEKSINILLGNDEFNEEYLEVGVLEEILIYLFGNGILHNELYRMHMVFNELDIIDLDSLATFINSYVKLGDYRYSSYLVGNYIEEFMDPESSLLEDCKEAYLIYLLDQGDIRTFKHVVDKEENPLSLAYIQLEFFGPNHVSNVEELFSVKHDYDLTYSLFRLKSYLYGTFNEVDFGKAHLYLTMLQKAGHDKHIVGLYKDIISYKEEKAYSDIFKRYADQIQTSEFSQLDDISLSFYLTALYPEDKKEAYKEAIKLEGIYSKNKKEVIGDNLASVLIYLLLESGHRDLAANIIKSHAKKETVSNSSYLAALHLYYKDDKKACKRTLKALKASLHFQTKEVSDYYSDTNVFPIILDY